MGVLGQISDTMNTALVFAAAGGTISGIVLVVYLYCSDGPVLGVDDSLVGDD